MRILSSLTTRTVEMELNEAEISDLFNARERLRDMNQIAGGLEPSTRKALEDSIYLISTVLGNHQ